MDFHTHNLQAPAGEAIINLPQEWVLQPCLFLPRPHALYSAGIHPWWTAKKEETEQMMRNLPQILENPQIVAVGECGLDALHGATLAIQEDVLKRQLALAEKFQLPVTLHIVRTFDKILRIYKEFRPTTQWTIHGFRGRPALAKQLLSAGFNLSFGKKYNPISYQITPPKRRMIETDEDF